jgi:hypothetical protein
MHLFGFIIRKWLSLCLFYIRLEVVQVSLKLFVRKRYADLNSNRTLLKYKARKSLIF